MKQVLDLISNLIPITGDATTDTIIFFVIGIVAFGIAWVITGVLASSVGYDSDVMSFIHWVIRIAIFVGLMLIAIGIAQFFKWFFSLNWWIYVLIGGGVSLVLIGVIFLLKFGKKKKTKSLQNTQ